VGAARFGGERDRRGDAQGGVGEVAGGLPVGDEGREGGDEIGQGEEDIGAQAPDGVEGVDEHHPPPVGAHVGGQGGEGLGQGGGVRI
jgi:hypothetical protein